MSDAWLDRIRLIASDFRVGRESDAVFQMIDALDDWAHDGREVDTVLALARSFFQRINRPRAVVTLDWFKGFAETVQTQALPTVDLAHGLLLEKKLEKAAHQYESAGLLAQAAIAYERAQKHQAARTLWARFAQILGNKTNTRDEEDAVECHYILGLVRFNIARNCVRDQEQAEKREAIVGSVHALEEAADRFETLGMRERAFDCYTTVSAIGAHSDIFEHVLEGQANLIRILREDYMATHALGQVNDSIELASKANEFQAAAVFAREGRSIAIAFGLDADATHFARLTVDLHRKAARHSIVAHAPTDIAEHALLAALSLCSEMGWLHEAHRVYSELCLLPGLHEDRLKRYQQSMERLRQGTLTPLQELRMPRKQTLKTLEVWHADVLEWEQSGTVAEVCASMLMEYLFTADASETNTTLRRKAMIIRLHSLEMDFLHEQSRKNGRSVSTSEETPLLIRQLSMMSEVFDYRMLAPIETLARNATVEVRAKALTVLGNMQFKRSAAALRRASRDNHEQIVAATSEALMKKTKAIFVDPLRRLLREAKPTEIRKAALVALTSINNPEAADVVISALQAGSASERKAILETAKNYHFDKNAHLIVAAERLVTQELPHDVREDLRAIINTSKD